MAFPKYESYKDSGVEWLGEIPSHWEVLPFKALFKMSPEKNGGKIIGEMLSVSGYRGIEVKPYEYEEQKRSSKDLIDYRVVRPNQLVVNTMWLNYAGLGVSELEGYVSPAYRAYWISKDLYGRFSHYLLRSHVYVQGYTGQMQGIRPNSLQIKNYDFNKIPILVPEIEEQKRIANFIDRITSDIDQAIAKKQRLIELLNEQKAILINRAVTKGLNPNVSMRDSGIEWIGKIPEHWKVVQNRYIFQEQNQRSANGDEIHLSMSQKLGLVPSDELESKTLQSESYEGAKLCLKTDLVLNRLKAHLGVFSVAPCDGLVSPDYSVFRLRNQSMTSKYFEHLFKTAIYISEFNRKVKGIVIGFYRLYSDSFNEIPCLCPPAHEQVQIQNWIVEKHQEFKIVEDAIRIEIDKLRELKSVAISEAVTGKIKV
ncbi:restriction endonuclease subunit S [Pseudanabaena galeata UHCC 0370]|uniref:Restriction endonuclease subunit S n=1 Tax=Pseudanabaena galeata UHCC 0370 TaxID=3110310 RepID=A0ABU5TNE0_9CYAN|nr:restriction endonuclease subunit S [Pseudanabaena galeata]MEA5479083.1 restriction endonuclease subunit S [Pseudanabaena galeata UHCC 0370]